MPKAKKALIVAIVLAVLFVLSSLGLFFLSDDFLPLSLYSGVGAMMCLCIWLMMLSDKGECIPIVGMGMLLFALLGFVGTLDSFTWLSAIPAGIMALAGVMLIVEDLIAPEKEKVPEKVPSADKQEVVAGKNAEADSAAEQAETETEVPQIPSASCVPDAYIVSLRKFAAMTIPWNLVEIGTQRQLIKILEPVLPVNEIMLGTEVQQAFETNSMGEVSAAQFLGRIAAYTDHWAGAFKEEAILSSIHKADMITLLRSWRVLDLYCQLLKPEYQINLSKYNKDIAAEIHSRKPSLSDPEDSSPVMIIENCIFIHSANFFSWSKANPGWLQYELCGIIPLMEKQPSVYLYEDGIQTREYVLQTEGEEDFTGKYFQISVRLGLLGNPQVPMAQIDGFVSAEAGDRKMKSNDIGYRMEGHFLSCGEENGRQRYEMTRGQDLIPKALKYRGYTTPANIRLLGICPDCGKSFAFHGYAFYMTQNDVAYSDDGLDCCVIQDQQIDKDTWVYETEGKTFRYYNSFNCPHCGTPYIDYKKYPENKTFGVSGCVHLGRTPFQVGMIQSVEDTKKKEAIENLREKIIGEMTQRPCFRYNLGSLMWDEVADLYSSYPQTQWQCASFFLDVRTAKIYVKLLNYPYHGAGREHTTSITANDFCEIAARHNFRSELKYLKTEEDWNQLFDNDALKTAISNVNRRVGTVVIPKEYIEIMPKMCMDNVVLVLKKQGITFTVSLMKLDNRYKLLYEEDTRRSWAGSYEERELTPFEAVWVENLIEQTVNNPDTSVWSSNEDGNCMDIIIDRSNAESIEMQSVEASAKYYDLQVKLRELLWYGSRIE